MSTETQILVIVIIVIFFLVFQSVQSMSNAIGERSRISKIIKIQGKEQYTTKSTSDKYLEFVSAIEKLFKFGESDGKSKSKKKLYDAGFKEEYHYVLYMFVKYVLSLSMMVIMLVAYYVKNGTIKMETMQGLLSCGLTLLIFVGCDFYLSQRAKKRKINMSETLPDCLDLLVVCSEAGLSLDAGLKRVANEIHRHSTVLSEELKMTVLELNFLPERRIALENLAERVGDEVMKSLVNTLIQSEKYGTPLSNALRVISEELRQKRIVMAEEKAARLPAILTVPMIIFILPTLFIVLAGPAVIEVYDSMK